jgi:two-component system sensor histidine kinase/response regulator
MNASASSSEPADILVVDDTPANLQLLTGILKDCGYRVRPVLSGALALRAAQSAPPDLMLLDICMPEMDGYEVCQRFKSQPLLSDIPIIFISALSEIEDKISAFAAGGIDYVTKPFQFEDVQARIRIHLRLRNQQRQLEMQHQRLLELERMRDEMVQMIIHDMRSPLCVVQGYLQLLEMDSAHLLNESSRLHLSNTGTAISQLIDLVSDVLDVSRMENNAMPIDWQCCDLVAVGREVLASMSPLLEFHRLHPIPPEGNCLAFCDATLTRRVLCNLVSNAIKFSPKAAVIRVEVAAGDQSVRVAVIDAGSGISEEDQEHLFEKFRQADRNRAHAKNSSGLGLAFCKMAIEAQQGSIGVDSAIGKGSTFWFTLPKPPNSEASP